MPTILTYHHLERPPESGDERGLFVAPEAFERQLAWLAAVKIPVLSLDDLRTRLLAADGAPIRAAAITFDDGYEDNFLHALPLLKRFGFTATFFITTGWIGGASPQGHRMMNVDQIRSMAEAGMTIGSHTVTHPWLARIPIEETRRELADSKAALESILGPPVRWVCYPSGSFNPAVEDAARELGYAGGCSVIRDNRIHAGQIFHLPRVMVMPDTTMLRFRYYFSPLYHLLHERKNRKRWGPYL